MMTAFHIQYISTICVFRFNLSILQFIPCILVPLPSYKFHRPDRSSNLLDMYIPSQLRLQFPFLHMIWTFYTIMDEGNCLDLNIQLCQRRVRLLLPAEQQKKQKKLKLNFQTCFTSNGKYFNYLGRRFANDAVTIVIVIIVG